jgi:hypothetical protein
MANQSEKREPVGFTPHSAGPASERAREQGWQTNEEERTGMPQGKQNEDGGTDYDYGAIRDFGDEPVDSSTGTSTGTSAGTSSGTSSRTGSGTSSVTSPAQPSPNTPKKEKRPTAKPRPKKAA